MSKVPPVLPIALADGRVRAVIENIRPSVDAGRFAVKRVQGDTVQVQADCFADGHDVVACSLLWRRVGDALWQQRRMQAVGNDRWQASFVADAIGDWEYTVQAWVDPFLSWQHDFARRVDVEDLRLAARTGAGLIEAAAARAGRANPDARTLRAWARELEKAAGRKAEAAELKVLGEDALRVALADRYPDLSLAHQVAPALPLLVERVRARFSSWYEFFPRSASDDAQRHGTFNDCAAWLPYVQRMGFDVLYFPPIHPIGRERRKGPNNTLDAGPKDVGSPWAIGAEEGGHEAILGELGTLEDFRRLLLQAQAHDIEIALDIALQCAPDHPWVKTCPQWFRQRADGSIQYAENPPKKYQDIYPFDFESADWQAMWNALAGVMLFWAAQGVRIFRVDNPHTKSFAFWEWAITRVRSDYPDVICLSEAFTRPRVMHRLAKLGFSQSYTYFTWRNGKHELIDYFTDLTRGPGRDYFRPNVWPNTPDILPAALQHGTRATFMARVALAATLSSSYGIYGPAFELLEHEAMRPGSEEYKNSEKYERRVWDRTRADSLADFIGVLNRARRANPALQQDGELHFLEIDNDSLLAYARISADHSNTVVCVVNLDPQHTHSGWLQLDADLFGINGPRSYQMHEAISDAHYLGHGTRNFVRIDPQVCPAQVFELRAHQRRENDFDYFL